MVRSKNANAGQKRRGLRRGQSEKVLLLHSTRRIEVIVSANLTRTGLLTGRWARRGTVRGGVVMGVLGGP
jgi:hypothetical protein